MVRLGGVELPGSAGLLGGVVSVDLFGVDEAAARGRVRSAVRGAATDRIAGCAGAEAELRASSQGCGNAGRSATLVIEPDRHR